MIVVCCWNVFESFVVIFESVGHAVSRPELMEIDGFVINVEVGSKVF